MRSEAHDKLPEPLQEALDHGLLKRLPRTFLPFTREQLRDWGYLFPYERNPVVRLLLFVASLSPAETVATFQDVLRDHDGFVVEGIIDIGQAGVRARRRLIDFGGTLHIQSFMRTLPVEDLHELVEAGLLLEELGGRRLGGLFFQGEMHAFVAAIVLRMARLDALNGNAEVKPPDGKFAEVEQSMG